MDRRTYYLTKAHEAAAMAAAAFEPGSKQALLSVVSSWMTLFDLENLVVRDPRYLAYRTPPTAEPPGAAAA